MKTKFVFPAVIVVLTIFISCKKDLTNNDSLAFLSAADQRLNKADFDQTIFSNSTSLTNTYFQYAIGTKYVFEGTTPDGVEGDALERISELKVILGVTVAVIADTATLDGVLEEATKDWYAQDDFGNVWYMGESVDHFNPDGSIKDHDGSWEAGINSAEAGIIMLAEPKQGVSYQQEFAPGIAEDMAKVEAIGVTVEVPFNTYTNCLKTKEWSALEKGTIEYKFYAPGVGVIKERARNTSLELVDIIE